MNVLNNHPIECTISVYSKTFEKIYIEDLNLLDHRIVVFLKDSGFEFKSVDYSFNTPLNRLIDTSNFNIL